MAYYEVDWDHYIYGDQGIAGFSDKINEAGAFGRDDNHFTVTSGLYKLNWPELLFIERFLDEKVEELSEQKIVTKASTRKIGPLPGSIAAFLEEMRNEENSRLIIEKEYKQPISIAGCMFEVQDIIIDEFKQAGLNSSDLNAVYLVATEKGKERPKQRQLAVYRTNKSYLMAMAGGTNETDTDTTIPLNAVKQIGRYLVRNGY